MKKYSIILFALFLAVGCSSEEKIESKIGLLKQQKTVLASQVTSLSMKKDMYENELTNINNELSFRHRERNIGNPSYLITLEIKQGTFTLDPMEHIKNSVNAIEMTIAGSFWIDGDISNLKVRVKHKKIQ